MQDTTINPAMEVSAPKGMPVRRVQMYRMGAVVTRELVLRKASGDFAPGEHKLVINDLPHVACEFNAKVAQGRVHNLQHTRLLRSRAEIDPEFNKINIQIKSLIERLRDLEKQVRQQELIIKLATDEENLMNMYVKAQITAVEKDGHETAPERISDTSVDALLNIFDATSSKCQENTSAAKERLEKLKVEEKVVVDTLSRLLRNVTPITRQWNTSRDASRALNAAMMVEVSRITLSVVLAAPVERIDVELSHNINVARLETSATLEIDTKKALATSLTATAKLQQNSGEDWTNVEVTLIDGHMSQGTLIPSIPSQIIRFHNTDEKENNPTGPAILDSTGRSTPKDIINPSITKLPGLHTINSSQTAHHIPLQTRTNLPCTLYRTAVPALSNSVFVSATLDIIARTGPTASGPIETDALGNNSTFSSGRVTLKVDGASLGDTDITKLGGRMFVDIGPDPSMTLKVPGVKEVSSERAMLLSGRHKKEISTGAFFANFNRNSVKVAVIVGIPRSAHQDITVTLLNPKSELTKSVSAVTDKEAVLEALARHDGSSSDHFLDNYNNRLITVLPLEPEGGTGVVNVDYAIEWPTGGKTIEVVHDA